jgi:hypothetical protein
LGFEETGDGRRKTEDGEPELRKGKEKLKGKKLSSVFGLLTSKINKVAKE